MRGRTLYLAGLLIALIVLWFGTLDARRLIKPDEGRYAEIPREMAVSGDWVTPRLNGLKYFEKPPLQYWATASAFKLAGENEWTARLWSALTGFLGVLMVSFTAARLFGRAAALPAGLTLASSFLYLGIGHINTLDMGLTFFLTLMVCAFLLAQQGGSSRGWMLAAWAAAALAVLSKGLVSLVLPGASLVLYSIFTRDFSPWRRLHLLPGLTLFFALAAPWHLAAMNANPEFAHFYFIHEHFERFLTTAHARVQPWWYFLPILALGALPWTGMMLHAAGRAWRAGTLASRFLLIWCVFTLLFFSISRSKLPSYILPMLPAFALLLAGWVGQLRAAVFARHSLVVAAVLAVLMAVLAAIDPPRAADAPVQYFKTYRLWLLGAMGLVLVGSLAAAWLAQRKGNHAALVVLATCASVGWHGAILGHETMSPLQSSWQLVQRFKAQVPPNVPFYSVGMYDHTLPFYLQRTFTLVQYGDELTFGLKQEPERGLPTLEAFIARWQAEPQAWAVMGPDMFEQLQQRGLAMNVVARDERRVIVNTPTRTR